MKVHEILTETPITEVKWIADLFKQGVKGMSSQGVRYATDLLAKKYSDDLVNAYKMGLTPKPLSPAYAEQFFISQNIPKSVAQQLAKNKSVIDDATKDAEKIMKATTKKLGLIVLSERAQKSYNFYKWVFAGIQGWEVLVVPTQQFLAKLDEKYQIYENSGKTQEALEKYQSERQALATIYVGQIASGLGVILAARSGQVILQKMVSVLPQALSGPLRVALRGATDAALLYFETQILNTPEGRRAIGNFMLAGTIFGFPVGGALQQSVGAAAVEAGIWIQNGLNKAIETANKLPGVNFQTKPGVSAPAAPAPGQETPTRPIVTPRTSFSSWGKEVKPDQ
jgi:hypothetical protein